MATQDYTVITRKAARDAGLKQYFTGKQCKQGHIDRRIVINGYCVECSRLSCAKYRQDNPEKFAACKAASKMKRSGRRDELLELRRSRKLEKNPGLATSNFDKRSRAAALMSGAETYDSLRQCKYGHIGSRFTKSYGCVGCHVASLRPDPPEVVAEREVRRLLLKQRGLAKAQVTIRRNAAIAAGEKTFMGSPCHLGHSGLRWVINHSCVECIRMPDRLEVKFKYDRAYRATHTDLTERAKQWRIRNPEKRRSISKAYIARRRAQEKSGDSTRVIHQWEMSAPKTCYWCGKNKLKVYHVDHYQPLSKGGRHEVSNLVIACPRCNLTKNARDPYDFARSIGRLF